MHFYLKQINNIYYDNNHMRSLNLLYECLGVFKHNRLRVFLTVLGMIIGVAAVILMMGIGQATQNKINQTIQNMGSRLIIVLPGAQTSNGVRMGSGSVQTLTFSDYEAIQQLDSVEQATPIISNNFQINYQNANWNTGVMGVMPNYFAINNRSFDDGDAFTDAMNKSYARVAVMGQTTAIKLFGSLDKAIGETIRINKIPFMVVGLLSAKGQSLDGRDQDDAIFVPFSTAKQQLIRSTFVGSVRLISVQAKADFELINVQQDIQNILHIRHKIKENSEDDFTIRDLSAVAKTASDAARNMSILLGAVAFISLIVGGIGIMNIMLVSVTERTKEIGIRLAIGAKPKYILWQFLIESIQVCIFGGLLGVLFAMICTWLITNIDSLNIDIQITWFSIILSFGFSVSIGIFFGYYPAYKASKLNIIDALRQD
jgi:putative ABC transport system permease protein